MTDLSIIGESPKRPDMPGKVSGRALYAGDLSLPGMLHAKTKRSNVAHARIKRIDATRALAYEGVKAVLTHNDVESLATLAFLRALTGAARSTAADTARAAIAAAA